MKLLKKDYIKNLILAVMLIASIFTNVCATDEDVENVLFMNFNSASEAGTVVSEDGYVASAEVKNGVLNMQSDALIYWRVPATGTYQANSNGKKEAFNLEPKIKHGMGMRADQAYGANFLDGPYVDDYGNTYDYYGNVNDAGLMVRDKTDLTTGETLSAFGTVSYYQNRNMVAGKTSLRLDVNEKIAESVGSDITFKIKLYAEGDGANADLCYGETGQVSLLEGVAEEDKAADGIAGGKWIEAEISVTDADLTSKNAGNNFPCNICITRTEGSADIFIHSVEIYPNDTSEVDGTSLTYPINVEGIDRNSTTAFDLTIPEEESIVEACADTELEGALVCSTVDKYNTAGSVMYAKILNDIEEEGVKLKYEVGADGALSVYACTPDGDVWINEDAPMFVGTAYNYAVSVDFETGAYNVEIKQGSNVVASGENYAGLLGAQFKTAYIGFEQSLAESRGVKAIIDNISVDVQLAQDYKDCRAVANELTLPEVTSENFDLPVTGANGTAIEWLVVGGDTDAIVIEGDSATVIPAREEQSVVLTAVVTKNGEEYRRDFTVTVTGLAGTATEVPEVKEEDTQISGGVASIKVPVIVMAPGASDSASVTDVKLVIMAVDRTSGRINAKGEYTAAVDENDPYGNIEFTDVKTTTGFANAGDKIVCYVWDQDNRPINNNAPVVSDFKVSNKASGAVLDWDAYDDYDAVTSFDIYRDSVLIDTMTITADGETSKMSAAWEPIIKQDVCGSDVASARDKMYRYVDRNVEIGAEHTYKVVPKDKNLSQGKDSEILAGQKQEMYYLVPDGTSDATVNSEFNGNGKIALLYNGDAARESYTEDARTKSDFELPGRYLENNRPVDMNGDGKITEDEHIGNHYIQFKVKDFTEEKSKDDVVVRFKFKTTGDTTVQFHYNHEIDPSHPVDAIATYYDNGPKLNIASGNDEFKPGEWIIWEIKLLNAEFGTTTSRFGGAHFGLSVIGNNVGLYLNEVEAISLSEWE